MINLFRAANRAVFSFPLSEDIGDKQERSYKERENRSSEFTSMGTGSNAVNCLGCCLSFLPCWISPKASKPSNFYQIMMYPGIYD